MLRKSRPTLCCRIGPNLVLIRPPSVYQSFCTVRFYYRCTDTRLKATGNTLSAFQRSPNAISTVRTFEFSCEFCNVVVVVVLIETSTEIRRNRRRRLATSEAVVTSPLRRITQNTKCITNRCDSHTQKPTSDTVQCETCLIGVTMQGKCHHDEAKTHGSGWVGHCRLVVHSRSGSTDNRDINQITPTTLGRHEFLSETEN